MNMKDALKDIIDSTGKSKSSNLEKMLRDKEESKEQFFNEEKFTRIIDKIISFVIEKSEEEEVGLTIFAMILVLDDYIKEVEEVGAFGIRDEVIERLRKSKGDLFDE